MQRNLPLRRIRDRSYKTYRARVQSEKRLKAIGNWWNAAQVALGSALLAVSIVFLKGDSALLPGGDVSLAVLSVLSLVVSIVISNLSYAARAQDMFRSYREIQALSVEAERWLDTKVFVPKRDLDQISRQYQVLLDTSANHTTLDYLRAEADGTLFSLPAPAAAASLIPYVTPTILISGSVAMVVFVVVKFIEAGIG